MGRAFEKNGTLHIVEDGVELNAAAREPAFTDIHKRLMARLAENQPQYRIVTERHEDDPDDDPIDGRGALVAALVGVWLAFSGVFAWVVWWKP